MTADAFAERLRQLVGEAWDAGLGPEHALAVLESIVATIRAYDT